MKIVIAITGPNYQSGVTRDWTEAQIEALIKTMHRPKCQWAPGLRDTRVFGDEVNGERKTLIFFPD